VSTYSRTWIPSEAQASRLARQQPGEHSGVQRVAAHRAASLRSARRRASLGFRCTVSASSRIERAAWVNSSRGECQLVSLVGSRPDGPLSTPASASARLGRAPSRAESATGATPAVRHPRPSLPRVPHRQPRRRTTVPRPGWAEPPPLGRGDLQDLSPLPASSRVQVLRDLLERQLLEARDECPSRLSATSFTPPMGWSARLRIGGTRDPAEGAAARSDRKSRPM